MQARSEEARIKFGLEMQKLQEEMAFRREESERRKTDLDAAIRLKELQISAEMHKLDMSAAAPVVEPKSEIERHKEAVEVAQMKVQLAKMQAEYAEMVSRLQGFDNLQEILDQVGADPANIAPIAPRRPRDRVYTVIRNETGQMTGVHAQDVPDGAMTGG